VSESGTVNQEWATFTQPDKTVAFVLPRMRAMANSIYPGTPVSITEWNGALAGESDFSTALVDADAYGILGRERVWGATRWVAAVETDPAYQALMLYRNADGSHHGFQTLSVFAEAESPANNALADVFSVYGATDPAGETLTLMVINKDPANHASVAFNLHNFKPASMKTYTLSSASPTKIVAAAGKPWSATQTFAPYSATLIVAAGKSTETAAAEWDLNPDTLLAPTSSTITIAPMLTSGTGPVTLVSGIGTGGVRVALTGKTIAAGANGQITLSTPAKPGLYAYAVTGKDSGGAMQTKPGWVLVTVPAATLAKTGDKQSASPGAKITLTATFQPDSSGATAGGVDLLFTASAGALSERIVRTAANGQATVALTLPSKPGPVMVTAVGPVFWGTPAATFIETVQ
jgi:hypothetical protein